MSWLSLPLRNAVHVLPVEDLREHVCKEDCWCTPTDDEGVIIHNSLDGRELFERGERLTS